MAILQAGEKQLHPLSRGRYAWLQLARGAVALNDHVLMAGDGPAIDGESGIRIQAGTAAEILLFDLA